MMITNLISFSPLTIDSFMLSATLLIGVIVTLFLAMKNHLRKK